MVSQVLTFYIAFVHFLCSKQNKELPSAFKEGYQVTAPNKSKEPAADRINPPIEIRPPQETRPVGTFDPNYQTLAGLNNADVFQKKDGDAIGGAVGGRMAIKPPPPGHLKMVGTYDPNYQTLAGMNNDDVFKNKNAGGGGGFGGGSGGLGGGGPGRPPAAAPPKPGGPKMVAAFDPNYQTLAGLNNEEVFKPKGGALPAGGAGQQWETY